MIPLLVPGLVRKSQASSKSPNSPSVTKSGPPLPGVRTNAPSFTVQVSGNAAVLYPCQPLLFFPSKSEVQPAFFSASVSALWSTLSVQVVPSVTPPVAAHSVPRQRRTLNCGSLIDGL